MRNRIISFLLAVCMIVSAAPTYVGAVEAASVIAGDVTAYPGNSVTLTVSAKDLEAVASMELFFYYDASVMSVTNASEGSWISGEFVSVNTSVPGEVRLSLMSLAGISGSGTLLWITFEMNTDCPAGTYAIKTAVGEAYNTSLQAIAIAANSGSITVQEASKEYFDISCWMSAYTASQGDTLTYSLGNSYNFGFAGADFLVYYDSALLRVDSVSLCSDLLTEGAIYDVNTDTPGTIHISYISTASVSSYSLFDVQFSVIANVNEVTAISAEVKEAYKENLMSYLPGSTSQNLSLVKLPVPEDHPDFYLEADVLIVGEESSASVILEGGSCVAAGDFTVRYDPETVRIISVTSALRASGDMTTSGTVIINDNFSDGEIHFSYVNMAGESGSDLPLIRITWVPIASPVTHYQVTLSGSMVVDADQNAVTLEYVTDTGCIYTPQVITDAANETSYTVYNCTCGEYYVAECSHAEGHAFSAVMISATCAEAGYVLAYCNNCGGAYLTEILAVLSHDYQAIVTLPTCTEQGYTAHTCSNCGDTYTDSYVEATGHNFGIHTSNGDGTKTAHCQNPNCPEVDVIYAISMTLTGLPAKTEYMEGEALDLTGLEVLVTYSDGSSEYITDYTLSGTETVTVSYGDVSATFRLTIHRYGDLNDDGVVDAQDLQWMRQYLAGRDPQTGESDVSVGVGADCNGDGVINAIDLAMLRSYLADLDPEAGESTVILGPEE